jgi:hypothetical protein
MFVGEAGAYLIDEPFKCATLEQAPGLAHKQLTRLERLAKDEHSSLLQNFVTYSHKKFYNIVPLINLPDKLFYYVRSKPGPIL